MTRRTLLLQKSKKKKSITEKQQRFSSFSPSFAYILIGCGVLALISISLVSLDVAPLRKTNNQLPPPSQQITTTSTTDTSSVKLEQKKPVGTVFVDAATFAEGTAAKGVTSTTDTSKDKREQKKPEGAVVVAATAAKGATAKGATTSSTDTTSVKLEGKKPVDVAVTTATAAEGVTAKGDSFRNAPSTKLNRTNPVPSSLNPSTRPGLGVGLDRSDSLSPLKPWKKKKGAIDLHFIHIPKCGGTSMTAILRQVLCQIDPERNIDCCTNPGFCDWHAFRRCAAIRGNQIDSEQVIRSY